MNGTSAPTNGHASPSTNGHTTTSSPSSPPSPQPLILIAGAGIGGLTTALTLHSRGLTNIHIFESSPTILPLGVGINIQPSAVLILRNLGLLPALTATGIKSSELNFYNRFGDPILSEKRGLEAGYAVPQMSMHRGEVQGLLLDAVKERIGAGRVHLGHAIKRWEEDGSGVTAFFGRRTRTGGGVAEGAGAEEEKVEVESMKGDVLIAADGINSTVRGILYPDEGPPRFSGRILWRGTMEREPYLTGASMIWAGHANQKFIAYPISARAAARGKSLVNWIAELRVRDEEDPDLTPPPTDWNRPVEKSKFEGPFRDWTFKFLNCKELIDSAETVYEFPMCDRDPVDRWSFGRVTLLGDAAHPMYPIGSNGASQAILDAEALTKSLLSSLSDIPTALKKYEAIRLPPTAKIVMANRGNGPDQVMQVAHERAPDGFKDIHDIIGKEELEGIGAAYKALAGFDIQSVNEKAKETEGEAERLGLKGPKAWEQV